MNNKLLFALLFLAAFTSCGPKHRDCPAISGASASWIVYPANDTLRFKNNDSVKISFVTQAQDYSPSYSEDCGPNGMGSNYCKPCQASAGVGAVSDTTRHLNHSLAVQVSATDESGNQVDYYVFDGHGSFNLDANNSAVTAPLASVIVGENTYHDVFVSTNDTLNVANTIVWKIYFNKQYGILGFEDRQTHSLFYRY